MGIFSSTSNETTPAEKPVAPHPMRRKGDGVPLSIIAQDMTVTGDLQTDGIIKVEGRVRGTVRAGGQILLAPGATIEGDIFAVEAVISGEVHGAIHVSERVELQASAVVHGDIITTRIAMQEGAKVTGELRMDAQKVAEFASSSPQ
ncbi:MAG: polymer-forming cytoskeletal protein [Gemmatimonadota bacterium]|jgi:cytoskeletal protein CcmA (bactofilin family)|nr:polymer-forming cytoskeletal protein [Gemmatimonadota bacterium]